MSGIKNKRNGFTLIEVVLTLALVGIILPILYSVFFSGQKAFGFGIKKVNDQQHYRALEQYLVKELRDASYLEKELLMPSEKEPNMPSILDYNKYYSLKAEDQGDGTIKFIKKEYKRGANFVSYTSNEDNLEETSFKLAREKDNKFELERNENNIILKLNSEYTSNILLENARLFKEDVPYDISETIYYSYPEYSITKGREPFSPGNLFEVAKINESEDTVTITGYKTASQTNDPPKDIYIPPVIFIEDKYYKVVAIEKSAFQGKGLTSVIIPDTVTKIGVNAFYENALHTAVIPNSITTIEQGVFSDNKLTSVIIPDSVTKLGTNAFQKNEIASVTFPDSLKEIGTGAFSTSKLKTLEIPAGVTIKNLAFEDNELETVIIGDGVTVEGLAFKHKKIGNIDKNQIKKVIVGKGVTIHLHGFVNDFEPFFNKNANKQAGTYEYNGAWRKTK